MKSKMKKGKGGLEGNYLPVLQEYLLQPKILSTLHIHFVIVVTFPCIVISSNIQPFPLFLHNLLSQE
jgi:hypothetical protein